MSFETLRAQLSTAIATTLARELDHSTDDITLEVPPRRELGDLAWPGALPLARVLHKAPRQIAETIADKTDWPEDVCRVEVAGPGFLNLYLRRTTILRQALSSPLPVASPQAPKVVVEHTNINPNKAAHIGHLRNAVLGDILVRCLAHQQQRVEVQNYIDDTGVQVADVVVGLLYLDEAELAAAIGVEIVRRTEILEEVLQRLPGEEVPQPSLEDFDDLCWSLYPRVTARYEQDEAFTAHRATTLHSIEQGHQDLPLDQAAHLLRGAIIAGDAYPDRAVARLAAAVAEGNLRCHLATMARLGIAYHVLPHESDILHLGFWRQAFELLKSAGAIRLESDGKNNGCWVMSLAGSDAFADMDDPDKILVRSNGTVTYTGKDIAYQLWKLGLLQSSDGERHDFGYRRFASFSQSGPAAPVVYNDDGTPLVRTSSDKSEALGGQGFGAAEQVYNVIDVRQSYPQKVVREAVRALGYPEQADRSIHFSYEMVALTPAAIRLIEEQRGSSLGLSDEEMSKSYVEMSGRRGIGVKADEFLDTLEQAASNAIWERTKQPLDATALQQRARAIALGALRYLMARQSRNRVLAFDFREALAFEGDTGPYLQYSAVRAHKIFDKLQQRRGEGMIGADELDAIAEEDLTDDLFELVLECARRNEVVANAVANLEFSLLAQHVHNLAQLFHKLYIPHPVVPEEDEPKRRVRRAVFSLFAREMDVLLEQLLGIPVPEEM